MISEYDRHVDEILKQFDTPTVLIQQCYKEFKKLMVDGLKSDGLDMPMIPSFGSININLIPDLIKVSH